MDLAEEVSGGLPCQVGSKHPPNASQPSHCHPGETWKQAGTCQGPSECLIPQLRAAQGSTRAGRPPEGQARGTSENRPLACHGKPHRSAVVAPRGSAHLGFSRRTTSRLLVALRAAWRPCPFSQPPTSIGFAVSDALPLPSPSSRVPRLNAGKVWEGPVRPAALSSVSNTTLFLNRAIRLKSTAPAGVEHPEDAVARTAPVRKPSFCHMDCRRSLGVAAP